MKKIAYGFKGERAIVLPYNIRNYQANNLITSNLYVTRIGYFPKAQYHFKERDNGAPENVFIYCEDGSGWIKYRGERYSLNANQAFILPANEAHVYGSDHANPWTIYWFHFSGKNAPLFSSIFGKKIDLTNSDKSRYKDRRLLFEEMYQILDLGYSPENLEYVSCCFVYFLASIKYPDQYKEINNDGQIDTIQKSILYMKENLESKITLKEIAYHVGYSLSRFNALFTEKTSYSPMVYYNQLKIQRACSYLQFSDLKLKEIAFRLGYYDPFHFSKAFKQEMDITPREYRKRYIESTVSE